jgi:AraC-like DNA-binding protein
MEYKEALSLLKTRVPCRIENDTVYCVSRLLSHGAGSCGEPVPENLKPTLPPLSSQVDGARYCFLSTSTRKTAELRVLMAGSEKCRPEYRTARASYPTHALELVVSGSGRLFLDGTIIPLKPGTLFSYGPGISHEIRADDNGLVKYFVNFTGDEARSLLRRARLMPGKTATARHPEQMSALFELLLDRAGEDAPLNSDLCSDYLRAILRQASETLLDNGGGNRRDDCLRVSLLLINSDYAHLRSVAELAARVGVSPEHLSRIFRKNGLPSPKAILSSKRMSHAAGLLLSGSARVKQISHELGFATPFHFTACFKRHFGHSPRSLRRDLSSSALKN